MKIICKINETMSIWADEHQYVIRTQTNPRQKIKHAENSYYPNLEMCFEEIFDYLCRDKLANGREKDLKEIATAIQEIKKHILEIMRPFIELNPELKGRQRAAEDGKEDFKP